MPHIVQIIAVVGGEAVIVGRNLLPTLTAADNIGIARDIAGRDSKPDPGFERVLELLGIAGRLRHKPSELSGGEQQRVAIARAIVSDPKLLLCDEPTGDLDRATADEILAMLQNLNRDLGKTIVMVTHDAEAAKYAKRVLHLDKGHFDERELAA